MPKGWDRRKMTLPFRAGLRANELCKLLGSSQHVLDVIAALTRRAREEEQKFLRSRSLQ